jgi:hypothetical protein
MSNNIVNYLKSLRFTLLIISLLGVMFLLGLWIPQESIVSQAMYTQWEHNSPKVVATLKTLGFLSIYTSPIMLTLWGFFFLNLSLVMWQRLPLLKKRIALSEARIVDPATASGYPFSSTYILAEQMDGEAVIGYLRKHRYTVLGDGGGFYAVKNRLSPIAFGLFHLSFFLILLGGLTSVYTRFAGILEVAEGESFQGEVARYLPTPSLAKIGAPPRVSFTVKSIEPLSVNGTPTGLKVRLEDARGQEQLADVNRPYKADNTTFVVDSIGVAPLFVVKDASGKEIDGAFMKLHVMGGKEDVFSLAGYHFRAHFYPDYYLDNGRAATRSQEIKNPVFNIDVEHEGRPVVSGILPRDGALGFSGYQLVLKQLPLWVRFSVIKEYGLSVIYAGFAVASLAVIWRFLFYRREIIGAVRESEGERRLVVAGRSEFYKSLAEDEFTELFEKILDMGRRKIT